MGTGIFRRFGIVIVALACSVSAQEARAQECGSALVCAQVMPSCDRDGNPMAPFDDVKSPCYEAYSKRCLERQVRRLQGKVAALRRTRSEKQPTHRRRQGSSRDSSTVTEDGCWIIVATSESDI
jgi:TolA-binding protein